MAKKKSLFDDRPMEIQELTYIIKQVHCLTSANSLFVVVVVVLFVCLYMFFKEL